MAKKKFIDKKRATTYYVTYRGPTEEEEQAKQQQGCQLPPEFADDPELADLLGFSSAYGDADYEVTEDKRKEILALGLPDDGYDYLRHLREPTRKPAPAAVPRRIPEAQDPSGASTSNAAAALKEAHVEEPDSGPVIGGPSVFIPAPNFSAPQADARLVDARALHIAGQVQDEQDVDAAAHTISAFTRSVAANHAAAAVSSGRGSRAQHVKASAVSSDMAAAAAAAGVRGRLVSEIEELELIMHQLEQDHEEPLGKAGPVQQGVAVQGDEEWADWLDEFVVLASAAPASTARDTAVNAQASVDAADDAEGLDSEVHDDDDEDEDDDGVGPLPGRAGGQAAGSRHVGKAEGSIASTYWRPERQDRKGGLQGVDEHFEQLALQYDDDELGDLDDGDAVADARGNADISAFSAVLDQFLQDNKPLFMATGTNPAAATGDGVADGNGHHHDGDGESSGSAPELVDYDSDASEGQYEVLRRRQAKARIDGDVAGTGGSRKVAALEEQDPDVIAATRARLAAAAGYTGDDHAQVDEAGSVLQDTMGVMVLDRGERWDCESVLSLRSNLSNHPGRLVEPQRRAGAKGGQRIVLSDKTGMPVLSGAGKAKGVQGEPGPVTIPEADEEGEQGGSEEARDDEEGAGVCLERRKGETAEERRARKAAVKEAKRASRAAKKELKGMFKAEQAKQQKQAATSMGTGSSKYVLH